MVLLVPIHTGIDNSDEIRPFCFQNVVRTNLLGEEKDLQQPTAFLGFSVFMQGKAFGYLHDDV